MIGFGKAREGRALPLPILQDPVSATLRACIIALDLRDPQFVMRVPPFFAETLGLEMSRVLFPCADRRFIGKVRNRDSKTIHAANALDSKTTRLLKSQFEHGVRHRLVAVIAFGTLRCE